MPRFSSAAVSFSEIAWMGTPESADAEWIELYNDGATTVSLDGYVIYEEFGSSTQRTLTTLSGSIPASGYFVVAAASTTFDVDTTKKFDSNRNLANSGESLGIVDASSVTLDTIVAKTKWPAGNSDKTKNKTMQRVNGEWVTATSTPRAVNVGPVVATSTDESTDGSTQESSGGSTPTSTGGGTGTYYLSSHEDSVPVSSLDDTPRTFEISAGRNRLGFTGTPLSFTARSVFGKTDVTTGSSFTWSFGDGTSAAGTRVEHAYAFAGEYNVVVTGESSNGKSVDRLVVRIDDPEIVMTLATTSAGNIIEIKNRGDREINLGRAVIRVGSGTFTFAPDTIVSSKKSIRVPHTVLKLEPDMTTELVWHNGVVVARVEPSAPSQSTIATVAPSQSLAASPGATSTVVTPHEPTPLPVMSAEPLVKSVKKPVPVPLVVATTVPRVTVIPRRESTLQKIARWPETAVARLYDMLVH